MGMGAFRLVPAALALSGRLLAAMTEEAGSGQPEEDFAELTEGSAQSAGVAVAFDCSKWSSANHVNPLMA
jgi:hypothetical protein